MKRFWLSHRIFWNDLMNPSDESESVSAIVRRALLCAGLALALVSASTNAAAPAPLRLSRADYLDRVKAIWNGQIVAVIAAWPFEHNTASVAPLRGFPKTYMTAPVDDDWYYEMCVVRAFEKYSIGLTVEQLGRQWLENSCGSWGSSEQALLNLRKGVKAPRNASGSRSPLTSKNLPDGKSHYASINVCSFPTAPPAMPTGKA